MFGEIIIWGFLFLGEYLKYLIRNMGIKRFSESTFFKKKQPSQLLDLDIFFSYFFSAMPREGENFD